MANTMRPRPRATKYVRLTSRRDGYADACVNHHNGGIRRDRFTGETQRASFGIGSIACRNEAIVALGRVRQSGSESRSRGRVIAAHEDSQQRRQLVVDSNGLGAQQREPGGKTWFAPDFRVVPKFAQRVTDAKFGRSSRAFTAGRAMWAIWLARWCDTVGSVPTLPMTKDQSMLRLA